MTYPEARAYLYRLPRFADKGVASYAPGLERIAALLDAVGRPDQHYPCVHLAGTNGKGSTASMIAAVATASGRRVGLHTSPHLFTERERLRIDGTPVSEADLAVLVSRLKPTIDDVGASFFEATVALSLLHFAEAHVDLAVIETGLGGRLDATNIVTPVLSVITHIGLDHTAILGDTLPAIAREKAGIIKADVPILSGVEQPECQEVIARIAEEQAAPYHDGRQEVVVGAAYTSLKGVHLSVQTPVDAYPDIFVDVPGRHQIANAALALRASELVLGPDLRLDSVRSGFRQVRRFAGLQGRLDVRHETPLIVLDVGHNPEGLSLAFEFMHAQLAGRAGRLFVAFGLMKDKELQAILPLLENAVVFSVALEADRAFSASELTQHLTAAGIQVHPVRNLPEAVQHFVRLATPSDGLLITGSHQVVAQWPACSFVLPSAEAS